MAEACDQGLSQHQTRDFFRRVATGSSRFVQNRIVTQWVNELPPHLVRTFQTWRLQKAGQCLTRPFYSRVTVTKEPQAAVSTRLHSSWRPPTSSIYCPDDLPTCFELICSGRWRVPHCTATAIKIAERKARGIPHSGNRTANTARLARYE
jgi:hypothetical protein